MDKPVLLIDNYDSFTHMLAHYLLQCDADVVILRNDDAALQQLNPHDFMALVISPGPETPAKAGSLMQVLPQFTDKIPVLGVCLGHQAIGQYFGATLLKAREPRHGKSDLHTHTECILFDSVPETFTATRYHSLILENLPQCLEATAFSGNEIMALRHKNLPVYGIQFHPESCQTPYGLQMIKNFVALAKKIAAH